MSDFYITSNSALQKVVDLAYAEKTVAIDTEFTREKTYYPILSLIQIAIGKKTFVIDCLSDVDLAPIYGVMADANIKKILHSSAQDLQIFYQQSSALPTNVVDVQLMANFCGFGFNIGYSNLVERLFEVKIDKKLQCSDWQRRPLHLEQIEYAALDVAYLEGIYLKLHEELQQKKREKWFLEEIEIFTNKVLTKDNNNLFKNFSMQRKFGRKTPSQTAQVRELILWREKMAQTINVPRRHFLDDEALEEIVMMENFHRKIDDNMRDEIRRIMDHCNEDENIFVIGERKHIMNEAQKDKYSRAKNLVEKVALQEDLREQFLITSSDLKEVILGNKKIDELIYGWRYYLFGKDLQKLISS